MSGIIACLVTEATRASGELREEGLRLNPVVQGMIEKSALAVVDDYLPDVRLFRWSAAIRTGRNGPI